MEDVLSRNEVSSREGNWNTAEEPWVRMTRSYSKATATSMEGKPHRKQK